MSVLDDLPKLSQEYQDRVNKMYSDLEALEKKQEFDLKEWIVFQTRLAADIYAAVKSTQYAATVTQAMTESILQDVQKSTLARGASTPPPALSSEEMALKMRLSRIESMFSEVNDKLQRILLRLPN